VASPSDDPLYDDFLQKLKQVSSSLSPAPEQALISRLTERFSVEYTKEIEEFFDRMIVQKYHLGSSTLSRSTGDPLRSSLINLPDSPSSGKVTNRSSTIKLSPNAVELTKLKEDILKAIEVLLFTTCYSVSNESFLNTLAKGFC
jgi:hypothetical protein